MKGARNETGISPISPLLNVSMVRDAEQTSTEVSRTYQMAPVDLNKNREVLVKTHKEVCDSKSSTDW